MIKLVAFDWNGTLLADTKPIYEADNEVIKALGIKAPTFKEFLDLFDIPVKDYYVKLGAKEIDLLKNSVKLENIFHKSYERKVLKVRTRAYTKELLTFLKSKKIPAIIFSNHVQNEITKEIKRRKLLEYFTKILANSQINIAFKKRSKKDKLQEYLKSNNIKPTETLIVGDTVEEIQIAREIGSKVVSITHGNCSTKRLKAAKPDYLITNLLEIENILKLYA